MAIRFPCPECGATLSVKDTLAGKPGKCPKCKASVRVPPPAPLPAMLPASRTKERMAGPPSESNRAKPIASRSKLYLAAGLGLGGVIIVALIVAAAVGMFSDSSPVQQRPKSLNPGMPPEFAFSFVANYPPAKAVFLESRLTDRAEVRTPQPVPLQAKTGQKFVWVKYQIDNARDKAVKLDLHHVYLEDRGKNAYPVVGWGVVDIVNSVDWMYRWEGIDAPRPAVFTEPYTWFANEQDFKVEYRRDGARANLTFREHKPLARAYTLLFVVPAEPGNLTLRGFESAPIIQAPGKVEVAKTDPATEKLDEAWQSDYEAFLTEFQRDSGYNFKRYHKKAVRWPLFFKGVRGPTGKEDLEFVGTKSLASGGFGIITTPAAKPTSLAAWRKLPTDSLVTVAGRLDWPERRVADQPDKTATYLAVALNEAVPIHVKPIRDGWQTDIEKFAAEYQELVLRDTPTAIRTFHGKPVRWVIQYESSSPEHVRFAEQFGRIPVVLHPHISAERAWRQLSPKKCVEVLGRIHMPADWKWVETKESGERHAHQVQVRQVALLGEVEPSRLAKPVVVAKNDPPPKDPPVKPIDKAVVERALKRGEQAAKALTLLGKVRWVCEHQGKLPAGSNFPKMAREISAIMLGLHGAKVADFPAAARKYAKLGGHEVTVLVSNPLAAEALRKMIGEPDAEEDGKVTDKSNPAEAKTHKLTWHKHGWLHVGVAADKVIAVRADCRYFDGPAAMTARSARDLKAALSLLEPGGKATVDIGPDGDFQTATKASARTLTLLRDKKIAEGFFQATRELSATKGVTRITIDVIGSAPLAKIKAILGEPEAQEPETVAGRALTWHRYGWLLLGVANNDIVAVRADCRRFSEP